MNGDWSWVIMFSFVIDHPTNLTVYYLKLFVVYTHIHIRHFNLYFFGMGSFLCPINLWWIGIICFNTVLVTNTNNGITFGIVPSKHIQMDLSASILLWLLGCIFQIPFNDGITFGMVLSIHIWMDFVCICSTLIARVHIPGTRNMATCGAKRHLRPQVPGASVASESKSMVDS